MQGPRRSTSRQAIDRRMDSAQDVHPGQAGRPAIPRSVLSGFRQPLPVIYSAQPSEAAVTYFSHPCHPFWGCYAISLRWRWWAMMMPCT